MRSLGQEKRGRGRRNKESFIHKTQLFIRALTIKQVERDPETEGLFSEAMVTGQGMNELDWVLDREGMPDLCTNVQNITRSYSEEEEMNGFKIYLPTTLSILLTWLCIIK